MSDLPGNFITNVVQVLNQGPNQFRQDYENKWYTINPNEKQFITWEMACEWFGNPSLVDSGQGHRDRTDEYGRLRGRYGAYDFLGPAFKDKLPNVRIFDVQGQELFMVVQDPENMKTNASLVAQSTPVSNEDFLRDQLAKLTAQMAAMQDHLTALTTQTPEATGLSMTDANPNVVPEPAPAAIVVQEAVPVTPAPASPAPPIAPPPVSRPSLAPDPGLAAAVATPTDPTALNEALLADAADAATPPATDAPTTDPAVPPTVIQPDVEPEPAPQAGSVVDAPTKTKIGNV